MTRWKFDRQHGRAISRTVRDRTSNEVIGGVIALRSRAGYGHVNGCLATRTNGQEHEFSTLFAAGSWLQDWFDSCQESLQSLQKS